LNSPFAQGILRENAELKKKLAHDGASTDASLNMVETDFAVQHSDLNKEYSVKDSTMNTSSVVDYITYGIIAVLSAVVVSQYKDI
jgi:hypothetical protein